MADLKEQILSIIAESLGQTRGELDLKRSGDDIPFDATDLIADRIGPLEQEWPDFQKRTIDQEADLYVAAVLRACETQKKQNTFSRKCKAPKGYRKIKPADRAFPMPPSARTFSRDYRMEGCTRDGHYEVNWEEIRKLKWRDDIANSAYVVPKEWRNPKL